MDMLSIAQRLQSVDRFLPMRWRLPMRYRVQASLGGFEPELAELPRLLALRPGGVAIDIGANVGIYTYALARAGAMVHAFEPQIACCEVISAWASAGDYTGRIHVHHMGAGAIEGELTLYIPLVRGRQVRTRASFEPCEGDCLRMKVRVVRIDSCNLGTVSFIKIDVEGYELSTLQGAMGILRRDRPTLLIEIDRRRHTTASTARIVDILAPLGYRCHALVNGELRDLDNDPWSAPEAVYNFIFLSDKHRP